MEKSDYDTVLDAALKKRGDYDKMFDLERAYKLVYPDGQSAQTIPGAIQRFTLVKYKEGLGKSYGRITLYLCPIFPLSSNVNLNDLNDDFSYESESEGSVQGDISIGKSNEIRREIIEIKSETDEPTDQDRMPVNSENCEDPFYLTDFV